MLAPLLVVVLAMQPEEIAPPRSGVFERDLTGTISQPTLTQLDTLCSRVDASGKGELDIAVVHTTNGVPPRDYATRLFNTWGVGHRRRERWSSCCSSRSMTTRPRSSSAKVWWAGASRRR